MAEIDKLTLDITVNNNKATRRINAITKAVEKLNTALSKSGNFDKVFDKINNASPSSAGGGRTSKGGSSKTSKNLNIFGTLGKWNYLINMTRYYGRSLANMVQYAMDYVETQNLWQVANRNNLETADKFIQKMNKAYGISEQTLMNYQAIFKNMLSALGDLSDEISSGLSMQLTQMAVDFASLYNQTIPNAMQKFQAVLSGQVRPIRSVSGYDITENTIFDLYAGAGGQKTMRQLSQIEKRLLRIVAVFDQMGATGATGDMAKTIESASNQARIMSEQFKEAATWAGQMVLTWMNSTQLLQKINAGIMTVKEIMKSLAYSFGYQDQDFLEGMAAGLEDVGEEIDEIQGKLLSFDKFQSLNSEKENILGIDSTVLDLVKNINLGMSEFKMKAQQISEEWLKILGYTYNEETGLWETNKTLGSFTELIKSLKTFAVDLFNALKPIFPAIMDLLKSVTPLIVDLLNRITPVIVQIVEILVPVIVDIINTITPFLESIIPMITGLITKILPIVVKIFETLTPIILDLVNIIFPFLEEVMPMIIDVVSSILPIIDVILELIDVLKPLITLATQLLTDIIKPIADLLSALGQMISSLIYFISKGLVGALKILMVFLEPIAYILEFIMKLTSAVVQAIKDIISFRWGDYAKHQEEIWTNWKTPQFVDRVRGYATGGFPEDGLFFANSGELVGQFSNGRTAVANNDQITTGIAMAVEPAVYRAVKSAMATGSGGDIVLQLDGRELARANVGNNARALSSNYRIDLQPR